MLTFHKCTGTLHYWTRTHTHTLRFHHNVKAANAAASYSTPSQGAFCMPLYLMSIWHSHHLSFRGKYMATTCHFRHYIFCESIASMFRALKNRCWFVIVIARARLGPRSLLQRIKGRGLNDRRLGIELAIPLWEANAISITNTHDLWWYFKVKQRSRMLLVLNF